MASTYVNNLRLNEMGTGDASGTWGNTTNTNLELIGEALAFGTEAITTNADTHATVVADGASDAGRAMVLKYTGTLDSACTITISPNTIKRAQYIHNGTSGSQNIIISQGSGANVTIPAGYTKLVHLDGAGSGAAVVDALVTGLNMGGLSYPIADGSNGQFMTTNGSGVLSFGTVDLSTKANINSQTFTGTPAAPTANAGTNTTQLATTAFVKTAVDNADAFPQGTKMVFFQASAPTGWTQDTSNNDKALRIVSGQGGGTGGTHALSSPPSLAHTHTGAAHTHSTPNHTHGNTISVGAHTLTISQMPSHTHTDTGHYPNVNGGNNVAGGGFAGYYSNSFTSDATGGGGSHTHSVSGSVSSGGADNTGSAGGDATSSTTPTSFAPQYINVIVATKD